VVIDGTATHHVVLTPFAAVVFIAVPLKKPNADVVLPHSTSAPSDRVENSDKFRLNFHVIFACVNVYGFVRLKQVLFK
jgi:hypothetical protein